VTSWTEKILHM